MSDRHESNGRIDMTHWYFLHKHMHQCLHDTRTKHRLVHFRLMTLTFGVRTCSLVGYREQNKDEEPFVASDIRHDLMAKCQAQMLAWCELNEAFRRT